MAQTDTRPGFRLPWSSDRAEAEAAAPATETDATAAEATLDATLGATAETATGDAVAAQDGAVETAPETEASAEVIPDWPHAEAARAEPVVAAAPEPVAPAPAKKPNKLMADLSKAMQATAEAARAETMERFTSDAKIATERVHAAAAEETAELRRLADEDVAGIRDWSKAEIARIREETEGRISGRKADLERELEQHAGTIEGRTERVNAFVADFEAEMAAFFERLSAEEDPARLAAMAEQLPEAPSLDLAELDAAVLIGVPSQAIRDTPTADVVSDALDAVVEPEVAAEAPEAVEPVETVETVAESVDASEPVAEVIGDAETVPDGASTTDAADAPVATDTTETSEPVAEAVAEPTVDDLPDPRIEALGLSGVSDFAAAEAEAAFAADAAAEGVTAVEADEIPIIADEVLAARIAGLVPDESNSSNPLVTTKVVVSGLVSVASIAGFKRHLSRLQGVTTVGVSSGPDGEFVFSVHHLPTVDLAAGITSLPGFDTRITGQDAGTVTVTARDPESHD